MTHSSTTEELATFIQCLWLDGAGYIMFWFKIFNFMLLYSLTMDISYANEAYVCSGGVSSGYAGSSANEVYIIKPLCHSPQSTGESGGSEIQDLLVDIMGAFPKECWRITRNKERQVIEHISISSVHETGSPNIDDKDHSTTRISEVSARSPAYFQGADSLLLSLTLGALAWYHYGHVLYGIAALGVTGAIMLAIEINDYYVKAHQRKRFL